MPQPTNFRPDSATQLCRPEMRSVKKTPRNSRLIIAAAAALASAAPASAAIWDGGNGTWSTTVGHWDGGNNWVPDSTAVFGGTAGDVTLGEAITAASVSLNTNNYVIELAGFDLTVSGTTGGSATLGTTTIRNTSGTLATFTTGTLSNTGPKLSGNMAVTYNGGAWTPVSHDFTGTLSLLGTGLIRSDGTALGSETGTLRLGGSHTLQLGTASGQFRTFSRDIELLGTVANISTGGLRTLTLAGTISGEGNFRQSTSQGAIVLTGNNTYSGGTYVVGAGLSLIAASDNAFGASTVVETRDGPTGSVSASTIGFLGNVNIGNTAKIVLPGGSIGNGLGTLQNFGGHNRFAGNIELGSNTPRVFGVNADSSLTLSGVISQARGFTKIGGGTLILTGQNVYGTSSSATQGWTAVNNGILRLDFSQTVAGHDVDILNFGITSNTAATYLSLGGGTLEIKGREGATNSQRFKNNSSAGLGFTINPGASSIHAVQNGAASLSANFGQINSRSVGSSVDFVLPSDGAFTLPTGTLASAGTGGSIIVNGAAFMTVAHSDWAARDASNNIVPGSSVGGFYTANDATTLAGNADLSGGVNTALAADTSITSLRFNAAASRTVSAVGQTLSTGGILVTPNVGNNTSLIDGGTLRAAPANANADLVVIQGNTAAPLIISSVIANTTATDEVTPAVAALTKSGDGVLVLAASNTYTGTTTVNEGVLRLEHAQALGSGNLVINQGVIGLTAASGDFTRALGTGAGAVRFLGSGGFAAYGEDRIVNIGGAGARLDWNAANFIPTMSDLVLGATDADKTVILANGIGTLAGASSPITRTVRVENGTASVDARITGVIRDEGGVLKAGSGTLELTATNTYVGPTFVDEGTLLVTGSLSASSPVTVQDEGTLSGLGTVGGVTLEDGGTLAPGSGAGVLNTGNLILNGGTFAVELTDALTFDQLNVVGTVALTAPVNLTLALTSTFELGTAFTLINNNASDAVTFADSLARFVYNGNPLDEGELFIVAGDFGLQGFEITYAGGSNANDVVITAAIPEPGAVALVLGGLGCLLGFQRRRAGYRAS